MLREDMLDRLGEVVRRAVAAGVQDGLQAARLLQQPDPKKSRAQRVAVGFYLVAFMLA